MKESDAVYSEGLRRCATSPLHQTLKEYFATQPSQYTKQQSEAKVGEEGENGELQSSG